MKRDNPLYESQEIRMEMFADVSDEEDGTQFSSVCIVLHHDNIGNSLAINCNDRGFLTFKFLKPTKHLSIAQIQLSCIGMPYLQSPHSSLLSFLQGEVDDTELLAAALQEDEEEEEEEDASVTAI